MEVTERLVADICLQFGRNENTEHFKLQQFPTADELRQQILKLEI